MTDGDAVSANTVDSAFAGSSLKTGDSRNNFGPPNTVELTQHHDQRGLLVVAEHEKHVPFVIRRVFVLGNVPDGESRGIHAHRQCHQFLMCVSGSVKAMVDDGKTRRVVHLDRLSLGLHMPPLTWGTQFDYSPDAVLLVLASHPYDDTDYIHDYDEFESLVNGTEQKNQSDSEL